MQLVEAYLDIPYVEVGAFHKVMPSKLTHIFQTACGYACSDQ